MTTFSVSPKNILQYAIAALTKRKLQESAVQYYSPSVSQEAIDQAFWKFEATLSPELKTSLNGRLERGLEMARNGSVSICSNQSLPDSRHMFRVKSSDPSNPPYLVNLSARNCTCPDHWKGHFCKHRIAAHIISLALQGNAKTSAAPDKLSTVQYQSPKQVEPIVPQQTPPTDSKPDLPKDAIIWGVIQHNGAILGVEVLSITGDQVTIRALPKVTDNHKLQPQFPFDGKRCTTTVHKEQLSHVRIFR